jgi:hypothetical protein
MIPLDSFDIKSNFWTINPNFKEFQPFKDFYKSDKSTAKKDSSTLMWTIALIYHPRSQFANLLEKDAITIVEKDYYKNVFDKDKYKELIYQFNELCLSKGRKLVRSWEDKLQQRARFIDNMNYDLDSFEVLDKALINTQKLFEGYSKALAELSNDSDEGKTKGDAEESLAEKGLI